MMIQETKIIDNRMHKIKSSAGKILHLYNSGHPFKDSQQNSGDSDVRLKYNLSTNIEQNFHDNNNNEEQQHF